MNRTHNAYHCFGRIPSQRAALAARAASGRANHVDLKPASFVVAPPESVWRVVLRAMARTIGLI